jgi:signal transduction histidine kinase
MTEPQAHVVIADDDVNTTLMLQQVFERAGFRVHPVYTGTDALQTAISVRPDLILLDITMPGLTGLEVLRHLRENDATSTIPTILMTGDAREPADVARGLNMGADDYVYIPFAPEELIARARSKIRSRRTEEALQNRTRELEVLLGASALMNHHMAKGELLDLAPSLLLDLLPGDFALVALYDDPQWETVRLIARESEARYDTRQLARQLLEVPLSGKVIVWSGESTPVLGTFPSGIIAVLQHGENAIGRVVIAGQYPRYEDNHLRLLGGIIRQIALALHNAALYELQRNYATHLEEMVAQRTAELESAQKLLLRTEKLASIGHLAASIAHEINNPLMPIRTLLESIVEDLQDQRIAYDAQSVTLIMESIERIRGITSRLLEFARDSNAEVRLLDINEVLHGVVSLNRKFFEHERIEIREKYEDVPPVHGSKDQLEQVFMNIALNAQAAMSGGGTFTVHTCEKDGMVIIELTDTGIGIPPEVIERIFDPFFSTKPHGTGLGLFVSHGIVQAHSGVITVRSRPNRGSTFTISLPAGI